jgi:hypothetical protein
VICLQRRQMPEALRWLKKASQSDQRNAMIWATLGYAWFEAASCARSTALPQLFSNCTTHRSIELKLA